MNIQKSQIINHKSKILHSTLRSFFNLDKLDINLDEKTNQKNQGNPYFPVKATKTVAKGEINSLR